MSQDRNERGQFTETVTLADVLAVFDQVEGPVVTSGDVAEQTGCSRDSARRKLERLGKRGRLGSRKTAGRVVYWRCDEPGSHAIDSDDPFWDAEPITEGEAVDATDIDDVLYGEAPAEE